MTKEQLNELAEALNILTAKSSIVKERKELQALLEDNMLSEAVSRTQYQNHLMGSGANIACRNPRRGPTRPTKRLLPYRSESDR